MNPELLHLRFVECGVNAKKWLRECALMLPEIDRLKLWKRKGFDSIYAYAGALANMSHYQVSSALWTAHKIMDKPALMKVARKRGLNAVRPVANIATRQSDSFWAEKAERMSKGALEAYVRERRRQAKSCPRRQSGAGGTTLSITLREDLARRLDRVRKRADFEVLLGKFLDSIETDEKASQPLAVKNASRHIPVSIERHIKWRTGGLCGFPRCSRPLAQLHHTQRWALNKVHDPERIVPLCHAHNEIAHRTLVANEEAPPERWTLRERAPWWDIKTAVDQRVEGFTARGG